MRTKKRNNSPPRGGTPGTGMGRSLAPTIQDCSQLPEPSTLYLAEMPPHSLRRGRNEASRVPGGAGRGQQPCVVQKGCPAMFPTEGGLRCPCPLSSHPHPGAVTGKAQKGALATPSLSAPAWEAEGSMRAAREDATRRGEGGCSIQHWFSWPRIFGSQGSYGSCRPSAPWRPPPWPEPPSGRPGWWRSRRGCCSCGARGRPAAGAPRCAAGLCPLLCAPGLASPAARSRGCT